jgi:outer membrane biosynthesis protein TonB
MNYEGEKNRKTGLIGTIIFHAIVLAIIIFSAFRTPLPLPAEEGVLINFGYDESGSGDYEPAESESPTKQPTEQIQTNQEQAYQTQDYEEAPEINQQPDVVREKKEDKKPEDNKVEETVDENDEPEKVEEKPEEKRTVDTKSLFPGKGSSDAQSQGKQGGEGNAGQPDGGETGQYSGVPGGGGAGGWSLAGRTALHISKPENQMQKYGTVVVAITVNKEGRVTEAIPGVKGSTVVDDYLYELAKRAALSSKFNRKPDAPVFQKGFITYYFSAN